MELEPEQFCSQLSRAATEPLHGTASEQSVWLLLEYNATWQANAIADNELPSPVQAWLDKTLTAIPGSRLLFIRRESGPSSDGLCFFVVDGDDVETEQYRFLLDGYDALLTLDLPHLLANPGAHDDVHWDDPIYVVCTNGRRDNCCAKFGRPVYQALAQARPEQTWQCTHIGGHRYAGTMVAFPAGICYGRLDPASVLTVVQAHEQGEFTLAQLRGRCCYPAEAQVAEYYLRQATGRLGLEDFMLIDSSQPAPNEWLITFGDRQDNQLHDIWLRQRPHTQPIVKSCGAESAVTIPVYDLVAWEAVSPQDIGLE